MAVSISRDLTVQVLDDVNAVKLSDRQQQLRAAIQRGEPKSLGVSQVMLGLMVMSYSIPLLFTELTEVVALGVPWWSGVVFVTAGVVAITLDKNCSMKLLQVCMVLSLVATVVSVLAVIIYSVDIGRNPEAPCVKVMNSCDDKHFATRLSRGVKSSLLVFTLAQTAISAILCFLLYRQRRGFVLKDVTLSAVFLQLPKVSGNLQPCVLQGYKTVAPCLQLCVFHSMCTVFTVKPNTVREHLTALQKIIKESDIIDMQNVRNLENSPLSKEENDGEKRSVLTIVGTSPFTS